MIADDFLAAAKQAIAEGETALAGEYLACAESATQAVRRDTIRLAAQAAIDDLQRIQHAERLCRYAMTSGQATPAAIALVRALQAAPNIHKGKSLFSPQNLAAFDWHRRNRSEVFGLIAEAAIEAAESRRIS